MFSTVSTRGIKFKFSEGERVLCFEPDPTKARVLYESKVLELVVSRDERGRKAPEYLIHFFGWNSSWDRCVKEEFILSYTEENIELQAKLATEAALTIKGKRKIKLPPLIKETLAKKQISEEAEKQKNEKLESSADSSSETNSSDEEYEKEVVINIPDVLKRLLDEDLACITKKDKLVKLPCKPNIIAILEAYVKHLAAKLICASPPKNSKNGKQAMPLDVNNKLNLCKEAMDGIRIYFDFTLPHILLYRQEKKQHYTTAATCSPITSAFKWEPRESLENVVVKVEKLENEVNRNNFKNISNTPVIKAELEHVLANHSRSRKSPRSQPTKSDSSHRQESVTNGESDEKLENSAKPKKSLTTPRRSPKGRPKVTPTRILRSTEKQKLLSPKEEPSSPKSSVGTPSPDRKRLRSASPSSNALVETPLPRITRKSRQQSMSPPPVPSPTQFHPIQTSMVEEKPTTSSVQPTRVSQSAVAPNCVSSSNSSSHSAFSDPSVSHQFHLKKNEALLQETLSWRLVPQHLYESIPAAPSLIYGPQHLLRLFVKLPEFLSKMNMSKKKMVLLLDILESFLLFLVEKRNELFLPSAYIDSCDEDLDRSS